MIRYAITFIFVLVFSISSFAASYQATIIKITDGDTVWIRKDNGKRVKLRLLGIDTPEEYHSKKMLKDIRRCHTNYEKMKRLGLLATKHAEKYLYIGEKVTIETYGKGYYRRTLVFIILPNGENFNELMVKDGYACVYKYHGHKSRQLSWPEWRRLNRFLDAAKRKKMGLWRDYPEVMNCLCE